MRLVLSAKSAINTAHLLSADSKQICCDIHNSWNMLSDWFLLSTPNIQTYPITRISTCQHKTFATFRKRYSTGMHSTSRSVNKRTHLNEYSTVFCQIRSRQLAFRRFPDTGIRVFRKPILPYRISPRFIEIRQLVCIDFTP